VRKILLSIVCVFLSSQSNTAMEAARYQQGLAATAILCFSLILQVKYQPYQDNEVNIVEFLGLSVGCISVYCGLWTFSINSNDLSQVIVTYLVIICNSVWTMFTVNLLFRGNL
jgi:hypothetical protein